MKDIVWEDPELAPNKLIRADILTFIDTLRNNPNRWAVWQWKPQTVWNYRREFKELQVTQTNTNTPNWKVHVRWVNDEQKNPAPARNRVHK